MPSVHGEVATELVRPCESLGAVGPGACMGLLSSVGSHVRFEVIGTGEFPLADVTLEGPYSGVLPAVPPQLIRARESLATPLMVADVRLFSGVLPDVHLQVRELQVPLSTARVEADKRLSLLLCLHVLLLLLSDQTAGRLPDLGDDESRVGRHGHLDWSAAVVIDMAISWHARRDNLEREGDRLVLLDDRVGVAIGEGEDHVPVGAAAGQGSIGSGLRVVVQWGSAGRQEKAGDWGGHGCRVVRVLGMLLRLVGAHHCFLGHLRFHAVDWSGHGRVMWAELMV